MYYRYFSALILYDVQVNIHININLVTFLCTNYVTGEPFNIYLEFILAYYVSVPSFNGFLYNIF